MRCAARQRSGRLFLLQRHTVEQLAGVAPMVQFREAQVPQMVDQLMDAFRSLDSPMAEQVIAIPKISCPSRAARTVLIGPQLAEQLVEVPTALSYSLLQQRTAKQNVDIPVPSTRSDRGLQGSHSGQGPHSVMWSRTLTFQFLAHARWWRSSRCFL